MRELRGRVHFGSTAWRRAFSIEVAQQGSAGPLQTTKCKEELCKATFPVSRRPAHSRFAGEQNKKDKDRLDIRLVLLLSAAWRGPVPATPGRMSEGRAILYPQTAPVNRTVKAWSEVEGR